MSDEFKEKLVDWWRDATNLWRCRMLLRRIKRFIAWAPVLWKDEDWDPVYLFEIMRFKISMIQKETERTKRHLGWAKDVEDMKIAQELLNRQAFSDFYYKNDKKNKEFCTCKPFDLESCFKEIPGKEYGEWVSPFCEWCKRKTQLYRKDKKEKEDFEYMWKHLRKYSKNWWS